MKTCEGEGNIKFRNIIFYLSGLFYNAVSSSDYIKW
jgi:hypothetical protein